MRPSDDTIALVGFLLGAGWLAADEIRHGLVKLGFVAPSSQWLVARLTAMTKEVTPRFARDPGHLGFTRYRVTSWAATGLENNWTGFDRALSYSGLPRPFPELEGEDR